jgi:type VI protein secretion system component VasK
MPPNNRDVLAHTPPRNLRLVLVIALAVAAVVVVLGMISRVRADQGVKQWTQAQATPTVTLVTAEADTTPSVLTLPAQLEAFANAARWSTPPAPTWPGCRPPPPSSISSPPSTG